LTIKNKIDGKICYERWQYLDIGQIMNYYCHSG
jgi:hypothetical protein